MHLSQDSTRHSRSFEQLPTEVISTVASCLTDLATFLAFTHTSRALRAAVRPSHYAALVVYIAIRNVMDTFGWLLYVVLAGRPRRRSERVSKADAKWKPMFYPFLRPDELFAAPQLPEEAVCSGGSSFFLVILEHLKKAELRHRVWYSPLPVGGCPLALALRESLLPLAKWLLTHGAVRETSQKLLLYATWSGNIEVVQWAIQQKLFEHYSSRWSGKTGPIDEALRTGHQDIATYLLGVARTEPGIAYVLNDKTIVELGAAKNDQLLLGIWSEQHTQLLEAVPEAGRYLNIEVTKVLHDHEIDLAPAFWSACAAVTTRSLEIIEYLDHLLDWEGAIGNTQEALDTSLYIALRMKGRKLELVKYLLSHGAQTSSMSTLHMFASKLMALESNTADEDVFFEVLRLLPYESWSWQDILMKWRLRGSIDPLAARNEELSAKLIKKCRSEHYGLPRVVGR